MEPAERGIGFRTHCQTIQTTSMPRVSPGLGLLVCFNNQWMTASDIKVILKKLELELLIAHWPPTSEIEVQILA